jgi:hypothetical protein
MLTGERGSLFCSCQMGILHRREDPDCIPALVWAAGKQAADPRVSVCQMHGVAEGSTDIRRDATGEDCSAYGLIQWEMPPGTRSTSDRCMGFPSLVG